MPSNEPEEPITISDVLSQAAEDISEKLNDPAWDALYGRPGEYPHTAITALIAEMRRVQLHLDSKLAWWTNSESSA